MRYIPQSKYSFEEICEQCRNAINPPQQDDNELASDLYAQVRKFYRYDDPAPFLFSPQVEENLEALCVKLGC
jgi:hypothetical protein